MKAKICPQCVKTNPPFFEECYYCNRSLFGLNLSYYPSGKNVSVMIDFIPRAGLFGLVFSFLNLFQIFMMEEKMDINLALYFRLMTAFYCFASIGTILENKFCALFLFVLFFADQISSVLFISGVSMWSFVWKTSLTQGIFGIIFIGMIFYFATIGAFQLAKDNAEESIYLTE